MLTTWIIMPIISIWSRTFLKEYWSDLIELKGTKLVNQLTNWWN